MNTLKKLTEKVIEFRDERNWAQFHNPKDVSLSLVLESSELMEHFQWKNSEEISGYIEKNKPSIADELSDVFYWVLLMAHDINIDLESALMNKLEKNKLKYPVELFFGKNTKYNDKT